MALRVLTWIGVGFFVLLSLVYVRLLFGPISLNFLSDRVKGAIASIVDDNYSVDWADFGLSLTGPVSLGFHLSTVTLTERQTDAVIKMEALEIGVSPIGAAMGRPNARVILIEPEFQMVQNLLGPRLSRFEFTETDGTGETLVRIIEGESSAPRVTIGDDGLSVGARRGDAMGLRSDNDWLKLNVEALDETLGEIARQAMSGQVSRIDIRDGSIGMVDTVYGRYRQFDAVDLELRAGRQDGRVRALFEATIAGRTLDGAIVRQLEGETTRIDAEVHNFDFSTVVPFLDDDQSLGALKGTGGLVLGVTFDAASGEVRSGAFEIDLSGTSLRLNNDMFEVRTEPFVVDWVPQESRFSVPELEFAIGQSRGVIAGDIVMGFDQQFGPTLGMSFRARDLWLHPDDLEAPDAPFEAFSFEGWSAPLYGAIGIDRLVGVRDEMSIVMQGRLDMVRDGIGLDVTMSGSGASADDIARLWPYLFAREGREWFTENVSSGTLRAANMHFDFPVGSISLDGEPRPVPEGSMTIDLLGDDVQLNRMEGLPEFDVAGETRLTMRDNQLTVSIDRARLPEFSDDIAISNAAYINQNVSAQEQVFEVSGDLSGSVSSILQIADSDNLDLLSDLDLGVDVDLESLVETVEGQLDTTIIATIAMDDTGQMVGTDYALNGSIGGLASGEPIQGLDISEGAFSFTASQAGFQVRGDALVGDVPIDVEASQSGSADPRILIGSTFDVADATDFGMDLSEFMSGTVRVVAEPLDDGEVELSADLTDTALTISDIGITKARGTPGNLSAVIALREDDIGISNVELGFGSVRLEGDMGFSTAGELISADFSRFQISDGDSARVTMTPIEGGYAFAIDGEQLDLKPVLKRFFNLEGDDSAEASEDLEDQLFAVSVNLDRAIGYYGEVAYNVDLDLSVRGDQLRRVDLATQFNGNRSASATTNPLETGRVITYATNDLGAMLRFTGVYPRLVGGEGSMVMRYDEPSNTDTGEFVVRNFAVVDEDNLGAIIGEHDESRDTVGVSALEFDYGRAEFVRFPDRIEIVEAAVYGETVGGTIRGNVLTQAGQYDLAGTYVPLFGLNNFFQQIPILGPIFGGREGEGLIGVTFAVRGPLANPELLINPVSILAPGVFRTLFEYRAANQPDTRTQE